MALLRPTIRADGSELWFTWNPRRKSDAVDEFFRGEKSPDNAIIVKANYSDNPFFPSVLEEEMQLVSACGAYDEAVKRRPGKLITLRQKARVIKKNR